MDFCADFIVMVKKIQNDSSRRPLRSLQRIGREVLTSCWIKPMVPRGKPIISIGFNYRVWKVISFIVTENSGITKAGLLYLYKYPYLFSNFVILPVAFTLVIYKFFGCVNEFDSHNKSR